MGKTAKQTERDMVDRLRAMGLRKQLAKNVAHTAANVKGQLPKSAQSALKDMVSKFEDRGSGKKVADPIDTDSAVAKKAGKKRAKKAKKKAKKKAAKKLG
ncbi:MAG TPA: hypothetical protein VFR49_09600 [Solirubrobacteraceae bacterium]|nr:hypothetical protein [Solirubrobacteraceae bacterium]